MTVEDTAVIRALRAVGASPEARARLTAALRDVEPLLARPGLNVRTEITGPIVDVLHSAVERVDVTLANGVAFTALYSGQIARDLVMRAEEVPDHVFEPQTTKLLLHLAAGARNVIIGGAYSGDHAVLIASAIAPSGGVVHAFEPNGRQLRMLVENAARNGLSNIRPVPLGLWNDERARLTFSGSDELAHTELATEGEIAVTTIDSYCSRNGVTDVGLIMLDIEGSELPALEGARRLLQRDDAPNVVFEIHRSYVDWSEGLRSTPIARYLERCGYRLFAVRDFQSHVAMPGLPVELVPPDSAYLEGPPHGFNMLAVKDETVLDDPIFRIVPDVSPKLLHHRDPALHYPSAWTRGRT
ncbi:MAG TPA: FkbM family methyltransferase [Candidatus Elarobacter sp.]